MMGQGAALPPPSSSAFPASYPYAYGSPLPSAILRPLQQPLYDTELVINGGLAEINFFQRQLGQTTAQGGLTKSLAETNVNQPGQLANPLEFSLFGFTFVMATDRIDQANNTVNFVTQDDFLSVYRDALFSFLYTGNRVYLQVPLNRIPSGVAPEGFSALLGDTTVGVATTERSQIHNGIGHISNYYKFTIGRSALRIRPTESFQINLEWAALPVVVQDNRMQVHLTGLQWTPL